MGTFAARLKRERIRNKLSQRALADLGGVKPNAQAHYENGQRLPKADYLMLTADIVDMAYLLKGVRTPGFIDPISELEDDIITSLRQMSPDEQQAIKTLCYALTRQMK